MLESWIIGWLSTYSISVLSPGLLYFVFSKDDIRAAQSWKMTLGDIESIALSISVIVDRTVASLFFSFSLYSSMTAQNP